MLLLHERVVFTGLSILHRLYAAYGFNILKDLTFDAMHDITLNIIHHHLLRYLEAGILSRNEIDVRLIQVSMYVPTY